MERTISATDARVKFGEMIQYLTQKQEPIIVEKSGHPQIVMLSIEHYRDLQRQLERLDLGVISWVERVKQTREKIAAELGERGLPDVVEIIHNMREERSAQLMDLH